MSELAPGAHAPTFTATAVGGEKYKSGMEVSLGDFDGKTVVLYFYPKDDTPGCTQQACDLRDGWSRLARKVVLFGISPDGPKKHIKFIEKHNLPFPLLSDESHAIAEAYGVWVEKTLYGRKYMAAERTTFIIAPDGKIRDVLKKVKPSEHLRMLEDALAG
ncbi:MAG: thioredoxin-dependent thiol peroxidase [Chthoniobacteraceae bacterium]